MEAINSPEYIGYRLEVFVAFFTALEVLAVALRFWARSLTARKYGVDDWLVVVALLGQFVAGGVAIASVVQGAVGYHVGYLEETNPEAVVLFFKYLVVFSAWYYVTISISKIAICIMYRRLFPQRLVLIILYITAGILVSTAIVSVAVDLAACQPFEANWAPPQVQAKQCINKEALFIWSTFPNIATDVIMLALPLPIIWRLNTTAQLKVALTATFLVGSMGLIASILRFAAFSNTNSFTDATYNAVELVTWTVAEPGIYLISACVMMYRPLLEKLHIGGLNIRKLGSGVTRRTGASKSRAARENRKMGLATDDGNRSIVLRSMSRIGGFEQLSDGTDDPSLHNGAGIYRHTSITITTDSKPS